MSTENHDPIVDDLHWYGPSFICVVRLISPYCWIWTTQRIPSWWHVLKGVVHLHGEVSSSHWIPGCHRKSQIKTTSFAALAGAKWSLDRVCWHGKGNYLYLFLKFDPQRTYEEENTKQIDWLNNYMQCHLSPACHRLVTCAFESCAQTLCPASWVDRTFGELVHALATWLSMAWGDVWGECERIEGEQKCSHRGRCVCVWNRAAQSWGNVWTVNCEFGVDAFSSISYKDSTSKWFHGWCFNQRGDGWGPRGGDCSDGCCKSACFLGIWCNQFPFR